MFHRRTFNTKYRVVFRHKHRMMLFFTRSQSRQRSHQMQVVPSPGNIGRIWLNPGVKTVWPILLRSGNLRHLRSRRIANFSSHKSFIQLFIELSFRSQHAWEFVKWVNFQVFSFHLSQDSCLILELFESHGRDIVVIFIFAHACRCSFFAENLFAPQLLKSHTWLDYHHFGGDTITGRNDRPSTNTGKILFE